MANPFDPTAPAMASDVPLMIGNAATEATLFMAVNPANFSLDQQEVIRRVARFLQTGPAEAKRLYEAYHASQPIAAPSELLAAIATDYMYRPNWMGSLCTSIPCRRATSERRSPLSEALHRRRTTSSTSLAPRVSP